MTNQEMQLIDKIESSEDLVIINTITIPCSFYGHRIIKETLKSELLGYMVEKSYLWGPAYNIYDVLGGYSLIGFEYILGELV